MDGSARDGDVRNDGGVANDGSTRDADIEDGAATDAGGTLGDFLPPEIVAAVNNAAVDYAPCLSADALTLYFESDRGGGIGITDIWYSTRPDESSAFGEAENLSEVNTGVREASPSISQDGLRLYFDRRYASSDVYVATRETTASAFGTAEPVAVFAEDGRDESGPHESGDGLRLYVNIGGDILVASRASIDDEFAFDHYIDEVNTAAEEGWASVTADERELYFQSGQAIYLATRASSTALFGTPAIVPELDDPAADDTDPSISYDGRWIVFGSNRLGSEGGHDIWIARREVVR